MDREFLGYLIFCGMALGLAFAVLLMQVLVLDFETRFGNWLVALIPPIIVFGIMLTSAFSGRNLQFILRDPTAGGGGDAGGAGEVVWVTRMMSALLLAMAFARVFASWYRRRWLGPARSTSATPARTLFLCFVAYVIASVLCPMLFSSHPNPTYKGLIVLMGFSAVYVSRHEGPDRVVTSSRWSLFALMIGSLLAAVVSPNLALQPEYGGGLPLLHSRLWGLAYHANGMGALALLLLLLQYLQPSASRAANLAIWTAGVAVLVLAQSKTVWLAGFVSVALICSHRYGYEERGRPKLGFVLLLVALPGLAALAALLLGSAELFGKFERLTVSSGASTLTGRTEIWAAAIDMWKDSPLFGYGLDAWDLKHRLSLGLPPAVHAHNQLLQALSTGGLVSAIGLLAFFVPLCAASVRAAHSTRGVSLALLATIVIRCLSEPPLEIGSMLSGDLLTLLLLFLMGLQDRPVVETRPMAFAGDAELRRS